MTGRPRKTHEQYENELFQLEADLYPLEEYQGAHVKIKHECSKGHIVEIQPNTVLRGGGCAYCSGMAKKTPEQYQKELDTTHGTIKAIGIIRGVSNPISHQCLECNHIWQARPHDIIANKSGCPACSKMGFNPSKPATLYYARVWDNAFKLYKIGVTNKTALDRLKSCGKKFKILMEKQYNTGAEAKAAEAMILYEYREAKTYMPHFLKTGYTELFKWDILLLDTENNS